MTIQLADLAAATSAYIHDEVEVKIGDVTGNLNPGEDGTLTVRWTNASAPAGVRLTDVVLHVSVAPDSVAKLKVPGGAAISPRLTFDVNSPRPAANSLVDEMFIFYFDPGNISDTIDSALDIGEVQDQELEFEAIRVGAATFSAHIHAAVDVADVFPNGRGTAGTKQTQVQ